MVLSSATTDMVRGYTADDLWTQADKDTAKKWAAIAAKEKKEEKEDSESSGKNPEARYKYALKKLGKCGIINKNSSGGYDLYPQDIADFRDYVLDKLLNEDLLLEGVDPDNGSIVGKFTAQNERTGKTYFLSDKDLEQALKAYCAHGNTIP